MRRSKMLDFSIMEDTLKNEIELDQRLIHGAANFGRLLKMKWPHGFRCAECGYQPYWIGSKHIYVCTRCERKYSLTQASNPSIRVSGRQP